MLSIDDRCRPVKLLELFLVCSSRLHIAEKVATVFIELGRGSNLNRVMVRLL